MKFDKPFHIKLVPDYTIKEPISYNEMVENKEKTSKLGGLNLNRGNEDDYSKILSSGGRIDWYLFDEPNSNKPIANINLMRIWALQLVTQMINNKAHVNEIHSEPKFDIKENDKEKVFKLFEKMAEKLHDELEKSVETMVIKKKIDLNFE